LGIGFAGRPDLPVIYPRWFWRFLGLMPEERQECGLGLDGYDAVVVEPYAIEDEAEELALGVRVVLRTPEHREVFEYVAGLVEVRDRLWRERQGSASVRPIVPTVPPSPQHLAAYIGPRPMLAVA
jgi:hypothetical protein